jgi:hypothetical protein
MTASDGLSDPNERKYRLWMLLDAETFEPGSVTDEQWDAVARNYPTEGVA